MYPPRPFQETDPQALSAFIAAHPLGVLTLCGLHGPDAYHLPFMFDESGNLHTHVARARAPPDSSTSAPGDGAPACWDTSPAKYNRPHP